MCAIFTASLCLGDFMAFFPDFFRARRKEVVTLKKFLIMLPRRRKILGIGRQSWREDMCLGIGRGCMEQDVIPTYLVIEL